MNNRYFYMKDIDSVVTVEYVTRKELLELLDNHIDNIKTYNEMLASGNPNACYYENLDDDAFEILYKDGTSDYILGGEYDGHKIKRQNIASIVYSNPCTYMVFGHFAIDENGNVNAAFDDEISEELQEVDSDNYTEYPQAEEPTAEPEEQPTEEQAAAETETAQVAEPENTYEHAVEMTSTKPNWFKDVFLPSLLARTEPLNQLWLTQKQTAVCARNMKQSVTRDDYGEHISYHTEWDGRTVEMLYSKKNQCGSIRFGRNAEEQAEADKKAIQEIKSQESERFRNRVEAIQRGNQRVISGTIREFRRLKEKLEFMQEDIADGFYDETESCYIQCKQEFDFFSAIVEKTEIQL